MDTADLIKADREHVWHYLTQHKPYEDKDPLIIVKGDGRRVWNQAGKEHLDAVSGGVWTVNVGYGRESIANAVRDQLEANEKGYKIVRQIERKDHYGPFTPGFIEFPHYCEYRSQFDDTSDHGVKATLEMEVMILREGPDTIGSVVLEPVTTDGRSKCR